MSSLASAVYLLCLATSLACAILLIRSWKSSRRPLLLWSAVCFSLLALNNLIVVLDMVFLLEIDLTAFRQATNVAAVSVLLYGFVWRAE